MLYFEFFFLSYLEEIDIFTYHYIYTYMRYESFIKWKSVNVIVFFHSLEVKISVTTVG